MKRATMVFGVSIALVVILCVPAIAALVVMDSNNTFVTGIRSLAVGQYGTFNVDFYNGTYTDIFATGFDFAGMVASETAMEAIRDVLNNDDRNPQEIYYVGVGGEMSDTFGAYNIPFQDGSAFKLWRGQYRDTFWEIFDRTSWWENKVTRYAKFSQVPIPGSILLLTTGLLGLLGIMRKLNK